MSLLIPCPHCGKRPLEEFMYGEIPVTPAHITDPNEVDIDRGFMKTNPAGETTERWFHTYGCRRWLTLKRNTETNEVLA